MNRSEFLLFKINDVYEATGQLKSFAKQSNKPLSEVESLWKKAKGIVKKQYKNIKPESEEFFALVVGVLKKMLRIE